MTEHTSSTKPAPTIRVRLVVTSDRVEFHAVECTHRFPRGAYDAVDSRSISDLRQTHAEAVELNDGPSPVKPCVRRLLDAPLSCGCVGSHADGSGCADDTISYR